MSSEATEQNKWSSHAHLPWDFHHDQATTLNILYGNDQLGILLSVNCKISFTLRRGSVWKSGFWRSFQLVGKCFPNHPCENGLSSPSLTKGVNCLQWHCLHPSCCCMKYPALQDKGGGGHFHSQKAPITPRYQPLVWFITLLSGERERDPTAFLAEERTYLLKQVHQNEWIKIWGSLSFQSLKPCYMLESMFYST